MKAFLLKMLSGVDGDISAKRVIAFMLTVAVILYVLISLFKGDADPLVVTAMLSAVTGILTVGAFTKS
jgi:uncharacterized membrane protein